MTNKPLSKGGVSQPKTRSKKAGGNATSKIVNSPADTVSSKSLKIDIMENTTIDITVNYNSIYFNADVTDESISRLCNELRKVDELLTNLRNNYKINHIVIYLFLKTNGGDLYSALSAIDCILSLNTPVYTVVDGLVASAGTLISIVGAKRFIQPNAYVLIHQLSSHIWGKMSQLSDEHANLQKLMVHIKKHYTRLTKISDKKITDILKSDLIWNAQEAIQYGIADEIYKPIPGAYKN